MDQAAALVALQEADTEIARLNTQLDQLPEKRAILDTRKKKHDVGALRGKADLLSRKLQADIKAHTDEIAKLTTKIDAEQAKLMETSDHRQVQALTREMAGLKSRRDKVENQTLDLEERAEKAAEQGAKIDAAIAQIDAQEKQLIAKYQQVGGDMQQRIRSLEADRTTLAGGLDADLLTRYEEARASKAGIGVGRLESGTCTACRMALPATQNAAILASGDEVAVCPACRRLLVVWRETDES